MALDIKIRHDTHLKHRARIGSEKLFNHRLQKSLSLRKAHAVQGKNKYEYPTPPNAHRLANENSKQRRSQWDKKSVPKARTERIQTPHTSFWPTKLDTEKAQSIDMKTPWSQSIWRSLSTSVTDRKVIVVVQATLQTRQRSTSGHAPKSVNTRNFCCNGEVAWEYGDIEGV